MSKAEEISQETKNSSHPVRPIGESFIQFMKPALPVFILALVLFYATSALSLLIVSRSFYERELAPWMHFAMAIALVAGLGRTVVVYFRKRLARSPK